MAKPATVKIRLVSSADTGFFYVTKKNPRTKTEKLSFRKYDPVVRKHVAPPPTEDCRSWRSVADRLTVRPLDDDGR